MFKHYKIHVDDAVAHIVFACVRFEMLIDETEINRNSVELYTFQYVYKQLEALHKFRMHQKP